MKIADLQTPWDDSDYKLYKKYLFVLALICLSSLASLAILYFNRQDPFVFVCLIWSVATIVTAIRLKGKIRLIILYASMPPDRVRHI